ncbi:MAG: hypothetical protein K5989_11255, partial [Lachnospiraceae bacterium]|nr:hypothetical protein [Lachnospiraceae bacterium]
MASRKVPRADQFSNSYLNMAPNQSVADSMIDTKYRSFMDSGDALFANEAVTKDRNGQVLKTRGMVIERVRHNLTERMKQENRASRTSATRAAEEHRRRARMVAVHLNELHRKAGDLREVDANEAHNQAHGGLLRGIRSRLNKSKYNSLLKDRRKIQQKIEEEIGSWALYRNNYSKTTFRKHYDKYDNYAKSWYELTHEFADETAGPEPEVPEALPPVEEGQQVPNPVVQGVEGQAPGDQAEANPVPVAEGNQHPVAGEDVAQGPVAAPVEGGQGPVAAPVEGGQGPVAAPVEGGPVPVPAPVNQAQQARQEAEAARQAAIQARADWARRRDQARDRRKIQDAPKNIIEYVGVYDPAGISALMQQVEMNANQGPVNPNTIPFKDNKAIKEGSRNRMAGGAPHMKAHTQIVMYSLPGENGLRTRFKFKSDFTGVKSRRQFTQDNPTALSEVPDMPAPDQRETVQAQEANLESDEKTIGGDYLHSEANAEILHANLKRTGETVHGFYMNGEFLSDENAADGTQLAGKADMKFFGRRNWDKQEKAERLREAIRKSPFFQHVNARTIQYYAGYNANADFLDEINENIDNEWLKAANIERDDQHDEDYYQEQIAQKKNQVVGTLTGNSQQLLQAFSAISDNLKGPALATYLMRELAAGNNSINAGKNVRFVRAVANSNKNVIRVACSLLLSNDTEPLCWELAGNIIRKYPDVVDKRTNEMMKRLPRRGPLLRMGLLDELVNHQGTFSEFDWDSPLSFINTPGLSVAEEELNSKRGFSAWLKRNLLNGNIFKKVIKSVGAGFTAADSFSDISRVKRDKDWLKSDEAKELKERRDDRKAWFLYAETMSEGMGINAVLGGMGAGIGGALEHFKGIEGGAGIGRDLYFQACDLLTIVSDCKAMGSAIIKGVKHIFRGAEAKERERQEAQNNLHSLDKGGTLMQILNFADHLLSLLDCVRDIASYHILEEEDESALGVIVNSQWGNLLQWKGIVDYGINMAMNLVKIVKDIVEIVNSTQRISRIKKADLDIETAISAYEREQRNQLQVNGANQQNPAPAEQGNARPQNQAPGNGAAQAQNQAPGNGAAQAQNPPQGNGAQERPNPQMGKAALENSNVQYFMSLGKMSSRKARSTAGWDIATTTLASARDTFKQFVKPMDPITLAIHGALIIAPLVTEFTGWAIGKLKYDRQNFKNNIASMLGDKEYASTPYFDKVLKRETGIVSSSYLVDLARIFT